jgi:hypothetical protein
MRCARARARERDEHAGARVIKHGGKWERKLRKAKV